MVKSFLFEFNDYLTATKAREAATAKRFVKRYEASSPDEKIAIRNKLFVDLAKHAYNTVPYYKRVMDEHGIAPESVKGIEDIQRFPVLTKTIIRDESDRLVSTKYDKSKLILARSGGTTGEPTVSLLNPDAYYIEHAAYWQGLKWMGWKPGQKMIKLFGGRLGVKKNSKTQQVRNKLINLDFLPAFEINNDTADKYIEHLRRNPGAYLLGYASAVLELAKYVLRRNVKDIQLGAALTTAEQLPPTWSAMMAEAFNCEAKAFYGCGEINSLGFQLKQDSSYRIPDFNVYIESVNFGKSDNALAITSLHNWGKPLIRYINGDLGTIYQGNKLAGEYSTIEELHGRTADYFKRPNGELLSPSLAPHSIHVTKLPVSKYQYIQNAPNELEFRYEAEKGELTNEQKQTIVNIFTKHLSADIHVTFVNTSDFIVGENMKHRLVIIKC